MHYLRIENKHVDQLWGYVAVDLCLCFCKKQVVFLRLSNIQLLKVAVKITPAELVFAETTRIIYWVSYMHCLNYFSEAKDPIIYDPFNKIRCEFPKSLLPVKTPWL